MAFCADLHVHSKYSRATSRDLDLEHLAWWAARKGLAVVGTGDCVHPGWFAEIGERLVAGDDGLFGLKPEIWARLEATLPPACRRPPRFVLTTEISTIYKRDGRTRKVHHLILVPDLAAAERLAAALARVGNIASDGRPILGLDSRDLLEIVLDSGPDSHLIPAHIWTPWFSALGMQSGFDSIAACYGDLADRIFAVETGLSSDPAMNWRVSSLDRYRLTSSSDAHSPAKLAREATRFTCAADYFAMILALRTGAGYGGTVEFFPEEGKYHLDGHRACGICQDPAQTIAQGGICPVCGKPLTVGVAHRVEVLADRPEPVPPATAGEVASLVPLAEILGEIAGCGPDSKTVARDYDRVLADLGPELSVLSEVPADEIARSHPVLAEAVRRLRAGRVIRKAGYDGVFGTIRLFEDAEVRRLGGLLFDLPEARRAAEPPPAPVPEASPPTEAAAPGPRPQATGGEGPLAGLDADQRGVAAGEGGPVVVLAGPGSGKTRALTRRIAHLVAETGVAPESCLAITFTRRAAGEMRQRLDALLPGRARGCTVASFHALGMMILRRDGASVGLDPDFRLVDEAERAAVLARALDVSPSRADRLLEAVSRQKRTGVRAGGEEGAAFDACVRLARERGWVDFDDLIGLAVRVLESDAAAAARWRGRFSHICADEFQDVDPLQYRLLRLLMPDGGDLCVIGDPDQAIYAFRGADSACFDRFARDYPGARTLRLSRNYRSTGTIVAAAAQAIGGPPGVAERAMGEPVAVHEAADERAEAAFVAAEIGRLMGGHDMQTAGRAGETLGFADFAVLYRTDAQSAPLAEALDRAGIPFGKSTPALISARPAVRSLLAELEDGPEDGDLAVRIGAAVERLRGADASLDAAALAEARRWLLALAGTGDAAALREAARLSRESDFWDARGQRVSLLTMHAAKGLEFPVVFVAGLEDGLVPLLRPDEAEDADARAEERRLFYVAMTRAMDRLYLTRARRRLIFGEVRDRAASPFLAAIADGLTARAATKKRRRAEPRQYDLF